MGERGLGETETVVVSSKGQVTIPSKLRKQLRIERGERLLVVQENGAIKLVPVPKLSKLAGVDEEVFRGRKPSDEIEAMRKEWTDEFEKRVQQA
ncbi:AbrB/MazE/SpoVT family DNA-binding domain-containing protein [bacterium]|nr:MAG: AbrB/MazE/SpoVT family DNA-binding domain-containing protein [bacterium]